MSHPTATAVLVGGVWQASGPGIANGGDIELRLRPPPHTTASTTLEISAQTRDIVNNSTSPQSFPATFDVTFGSYSDPPILWGNKGSGFVAEWVMNGGQIGSNEGVATLTAQWRFHDTGDFNADGTADVLWRHDNGQVALWTMNGSQITNNQSVATISNDWRNEGAGDFNGDGRADVLWHNDNGQVALWTMNGAQITNNQLVGTVGGSLSSVPLSLTSW